jgi:hypothetical protein
MTNFIVTTLLGIGAIITVRFLLFFVLFMLYSLILTLKEENSNA